MNTQIKELKTKGYVTIQYPTDLRNAVEKTIESWKKFCALPEEIKKGLPYSNNADGVGYELKNGVGNKADRKENFDITVSGADWLNKNSLTTKSKVAEEFTQNATALVQIMKPTILEFAKQIENAFGISGFAKEVDESEDGFFTRFIHYFGDRSIGEETATSHTDQSGFTLHLFESHSGLQCLTFDGKWIDMPVSKGETVIIPSMQLQLRSYGKLKALCHRVIATNETAITGRYSAVCFIQLKNTPKYDKERGGRLQEKEPGFNYKMKPDEFSKLFK
jgi:isopenicillin N synthase-like dioxygenase